MDTIPDPELAWRELFPRVRFRSRRNIERRGANTLPLSGTRQAMWHLSKRRGEEVDEVVGVVRGAPRDKVWEEVKGAGWRWEIMVVGELEQSSRPCEHAVQSREPKVVGGVTWVYKIWALVHKHAETQVRKCRNGRTRARSRTR